MNVTLIKKNTDMRTSSAGLMQKQTFAMLGEFDEKTAKICAQNITRYELAQFFFSSLIG